MRIVIAPDSFKGSLDAAGAADAVKAGVHDVRPDIECCLAPVSDGGEGMLQDLGARLADENDDEFVGNPAGIGSISHLELTDMSAWSGIEPLIASDVDNPLCGPEGASRDEARRDAARSARAASAWWIRRRPGARRSGTANNAPAAREEA